MILQLLSELPALERLFLNPDAHTQVKSYCLMLARAGPTYSTLTNFKCVLKMFILLDSTGYFLY